MITGDAALLEAAKKGNLSRVQKLATQENINCRDTQGRNSTPLHLAGGYSLLPSHNSSLVTLPMHIHLMLQLDTTMSRWLNSCWRVELMWMPRTREGSFLSTMPRLMGSVPILNYSPSVWTLSQFCCPSVAACGYCSSADQVQHLR